MESARRRLRFNLRTVLFWMAFLALLIGWFTSNARERARSRELVQQLMNARSQVRLAESRAEFQVEAHAEGGPKARSGLSSGRFEGVDLRDVVIQAGISEFQRTVFDNSDLSHASLAGGGASFQGASFKNTKLRSVKLTGGGSSFQMATFEGADLTDAALTGNLQAMSLRNAKCVGATISGSFQGTSIDGTQFQKADLSAIRSNDLKSCYFEVPPTYDANTKFPQGFDPKAAGWTKFNIEKETNE